MNSGSYALSFSNWSSELNFKEKIARPDIKQSVSEIAPGLLKPWVDLLNEVRIFERRAECVKAGLVVCILFLKS